MSDALRYRSCNWAYDRAIGKWCPGEPAVAEAAEPETSTAATLAALGITLATTPPPDEHTRIDELTMVGELARLRELAAVATEALAHNPLAPDAPALDAPAFDALTTEEPLTEALAPDAPATEPEAAPVPPSVASIPAVHAWPGWAGWQASDADWQAPDEEPGNDVGPIVHADVPVASLSADETMAGPPASVPADETMAEPPGQPRRSVRGQVAAATGEPLAGALVTLVTTDGDEAGHAIAGSDGWFAVGDLREGIYTLIAAAPHFRPAASTFALSSEEAAVMIILLGIGSMTGKVTTAKDGSAMSVDLELVCPDGDVAAQYRTGKDGSFSLTDVVEGSYDLVVRHDGYRTAEVPVRVDRAQTLTIEVALVGVGHLYGAVTGPGGEWVPGVQVTLTDRTGTVVATTGTDGAGSYRFSEIPEGPYTVCATAFSAAFSVVEVQAGSTVAADVNLASL